MFAVFSAAVGGLQCGVTGTAHSGPGASAVSQVDTIRHPVFHIIEEPGGIQHMVDCEVPTEEYYDALALDMGCLLYTSDAADE